MSHAQPPGLDAELAWDRAHRPEPVNAPPPSRQAGRIGQTLVAAPAAVGTLLLPVAVAVQMFLQGLRIAWQDTLPGP